MAIREI